MKEEEKCKQIGGGDRKGNLIENRSIKLSMYKSLLFKFSRKVINNNIKMEDG